LAVIHGILSQYETIDVPLPRVDARAEERIEVLEDLIREDEFVAFAQARQSLGVVGNVANALAKMRFHAERLSKRRWLRGLLRILQGGAAVLVGKELPPIRWDEGLLAHRFLPPVVSLSGILEEARARWAAAKPVPIGGELLIEETDLRSGEHGFDIDL